MARIDPALIERLQNALGIRRSQVYALISRKVNETHLDRSRAAIALASEHGLNISKYANEEDLSVIRGAKRESRDIVMISERRIPPESRMRRHPLKVSLTFVVNDELRSILERDISELDYLRSFGYGNAPKACMVLSGSVAEALLLERLKSRMADIPAAIAVIGKKMSANPEDWDLSEMVTVSLRLSPPLLPEDAIVGANQLRQWRNLIHPGRELKDSRQKRIRPTPARARSAVAFVQFIGDELSELPSGTR